MCVREQAPALRGGIKVLSIKSILKHKLESNPRLQLPAFLTPTWQPLRTQEMWKELVSYDLCHNPHNAEDLSYFKGMLSLCLPLTYL